MCRSAGVLRPWHAGKEASKNVGGPRRSWMTRQAEEYCLTGKASRMRLMRAECSEVGKVHDRGKVSTEARSPKRQLIKDMSCRIIINQYPHGPEYTRPDAQTRNSTMGRVYIY